MAHNILFELLEAPELIWYGFKHTGTSVRWLVERKKFSYKEIYKKNFNGFLGMFFIIIIFLIVVFLLSI